MSKSRVATVLALSLSLAPATPVLAADTIRVGTAAQGLLFVPLDVGIATGAYGKLGLDVQKLDFSGAAKLNQGMIAGATDIGLTGSTDFSFQVKGAPTRTVAAIVTSPADLGLSVGEDIRSVDDLKGKRVGVTQAGTLTYWLAVEFAHSQGWGEDGITTVPVGGHHADQLAAIVTGQVAGVMSHVELGMELAQQHRGRVLMDASDLVPGFMSNSITASTALIDNHPDVLRRFLKGWFETVAYMLAHEDESMSIASTATGMPKDLLQAEWHLVGHSFSRDGHITPQQMDQIATAITQIGLVSSKPDLSKYYDPQFLPSAQQASTR
jgi:ABC-type nitrate/sulfonate/bicarbonate transport system substrate-binding protein